MKILFVRHGQSVDDVEDRYGGVADYDLTEIGRKQAMDIAKKIEGLGEKFEIILSSPLKRALQTAEIIGIHLNIDVEVFEYLKERNLNGVLTGMIRREAKIKYPEIVETHNKWENVDGSERDEDFVKRVINGINYLLAKDHTSVLIVTHGLFLRALFKEFMDLKIKRVSDGGLFLIEVNNGEFVILSDNGVEYEN